MRTKAELEQLYAASLASIAVSRTLTDSDETFRGDGIGYGNVSNAIPGGRNDYIDGAGGNDYLSGYGQNDIVIGGRGDDTLSGGPGAAPDFTVDGGDWVFGDRVDFVAESGQADDGKDVLAGNRGNDFFFGNGGNDRIYGGNFANSTASGADFLSGGAGDDFLVGGDGNDQISGGTSGPISLSLVSSSTPPSAPDRPLESDVAAFLQAAGNGYRFRWDGDQSLVYYEALNGGAVVERDELQDVDFGFVSTDNNAILQATVETAASMLALTKWTIDIERYANGAGTLRLLRNGVEVEGSVYSSANLSDDGPLALAKGFGAGRFVFDDATPLIASSGEGTTYQAIYRSDARASKADGPGAIELIGTDGRVAIQIHTLGNNFGTTSASEGCYTIPISAIQKIENLILACAPNAAANSYVASATSPGADYGITSGAVRYWDLFWRDTSVAQSAWKSQLEVVIRDAETIQQPTLHIGVASKSGNQILIPVSIDDGGDDAISKALRLDVKVSGVDGAMLTDDADERTSERQVIIEAGETTGVVAVTLPDGVLSGKLKLQITAVTPLNGDKAYAEYNGDRARLRDLFFEDQDDRSTIVRFTRRGVAEAMNRAEESAFAPSSNHEVADSLQAHYAIYRPEHPDLPHIALV